MNQKLLVKAKEGRAPAAELLRGLAAHYGGLTQMQLAQTLGVAQSTISAWYNGGPMARSMQYFILSHLGWLRIGEEWREVDGV